MTTQTATAPPLLVLITPHGQRREYLLTNNPFRIGRLSHCDLVVPDEHISREHAWVVTIGETYYLEDRGSKSGLFVNGERIERRALQPNDLIEFGTGAFQVIFAPQASQSQLPSLLDAVAVRSKAGNLGRLGAVLEVARALESQSVDEVLGEVVDTAVRIVGAERGFLLLQSPDGRLEMRMARDNEGRPLQEKDLRVPTAVIRDTLRRRRSLLSMSFDPDQRPSGTTVDELDLRSAVCVPLARLRLTSDESSSENFWDRDVLGVLYLDSRLRSGKLTTSDQDLLLALATEASTALENARLWSEARENRRLSQELSIANRIQSTLLPDNLPADGWLRAAAASRPCFQVGGDYYDLMQAAPGAWCVVVADVAGKGVSAALLASLLQGAFSIAALFTGAGYEAGIAEILTLVNRYMFERSRTGDFATVFYCTLQEDGLLRWANAGHCPALLLRAGGELVSLHASGVPVGLFPGSVFDEEEIQLQPGDKLVLYTDGVTEAENGAREAFGCGRLEKLVCRHQAASAGQLHQAVLDAVSTFTAGLPQKDDATLVVLEYGTVV